MYLAHRPNCASDSSFPNRIGYFIKVGYFSLLQIKFTRRRKIRLFIIPSLKIWRFQLSWMSVSVNFPTVFSALKDDLCKQMVEVFICLGCVKLVFCDFCSPAFLRTHFFKKIKIAQKLRCVLPCSSSQFLTKCLLQHLDSFAIDVYYKIQAIW